MSVQLLKRPKLRRIELELRGRIREAHNRLDYRIAAMQCSRALGQVDQSPLGEEEREAVVLEVLQEKIPSHLIAAQAREKWLEDHDYAAAEAWYDAANYMADLENDF